MWKTFFTLDHRVIHQTYCGVIFCSVHQGAEDQQQIVYNMVFT